MSRPDSTPRIVLLLAGMLAATAAATATAVEPKVGERVERRGDEIIACGQLVHTTAPVVLWLDPGGTTPTGPSPDSAPRPS